LRVLFKQLIDSANGCAANTGIRADQPRIWRMRHQQVNGGVVDMDQHGQLVVGGNCISFLVTGSLALAMSFR